MAYNASLNITAYSISENEYNRERIEKSLVYEYYDIWEIKKPDFKDLISRGISPTFVSVQNSSDVALLYEQDDILGLLDFEKKKIRVNLSGNNLDALREHVEFLKQVYPILPDDIDGKIKVNFWYLHPQHGVRSVYRQITVPQWEQIIMNYNEKTFNSLEFLINEFKPTTGGQLIIWQGPPGTGKSYALRSLLHSWRDWCTAEYVLDSEDLFGSSSYLAELVLSRSAEFDEEEEEDSEKWKLFILEDSGEMLSADAKDRVGQGLSRLLNLVDGFIGQGLKILVLITTNEDFGKLHPAVSREGRCAAAVKFRALTYEESCAWFGRTLPEKRDYTLAELYGLKKNIKSPKILDDLDLKKIGFQVRSEVLV